jgi:lipoyl(octanoyl) transferase
MPNALRVRHLGLGVPYGAAMEDMHRAIRSVDAVDESEGGPTLLFLEHEDVITITRSGGMKHVKTSAERLWDDGITLVHTDRGGDVTFHGKGQLVGYLVMRLEKGPNGVDLVDFVRRLESGLIDAISALGVEGAHPQEGYTGVWVGPDDAQAEKLGAIGVGVKRGVTRHGFALNIRTDLERFTRHIVPCGLEGRHVTSLARLAEKQGFALPDDDALCRTVAEHVAKAFDLTPDFSGLRVPPKEGVPDGVIGASSNSDPQPGAEKQA